MTLVLPASLSSAEPGGSREAAAIAEWVDIHFAPTTVDRAIVYDLTQPPKNT